MADSTSLIDQVSVNQAQKEVTVNDALNAASPAAYGARRGSACAGLTWGYYGGRFESTLIANGTFTLAASNDNWIVMARSDGAISCDTDITNWNDTDNYVRLYKVVTNTTGVASWEDHRQFIGLSTGGTTSNAMASFTASLPGEVEVFVGALRYYPRVSITITNIFIASATECTSDFVINVRKNGVAQFTSDKPFVYGGNHWASFECSISLTSSDYLTLDVESAGGASDAFIRFDY